MITLIVLPGHRWFDHMWWETKENARLPSDRGLVVIVTLIFHL